MTGAAREALARDEIARAEEELRAADTLLAAGLPRVAVTRAYFAAFHMARALLFSVGLAPKTHEGVLHLLNQHFVRPGKLEVAQSRALARLQKYRGEADYGESFAIDEASAREDVDTARAFCARLRSSVETP